MTVSPRTLTRESIGLRQASIVTDLLIFGMIGGLAALLHVAGSAMMIGLRTGVPDWLISTLWYAAFIGPVYLAHRHYSFRSSAPHKQALPRYILTQIFGLALAALFSFIAHGVLAVPSLAGAILVIGLTSGVNFAVLRLWAFARRAEG